MKFWLKVTVLVGLVIVFIGGVMRSLPHLPKTARRPHARRPQLTPDTRNLTPDFMDKKTKKRIEVLRKKIAELQPRLAGAKSRPTSRTKSASSKPSSRPPKPKSPSCSNPKNVPRLARHGGFKATCPTVCLPDQLTSTNADECLRQLADYARSQFASDQFKHGVDTFQTAAVGFGATGRRFAVANSACAACDLFRLRIPPLSVNIRRSREPRQQRIIAPDARHADQFISPRLCWGFLFCSHCRAVRRNYESRRRKRRLTPSGLASALEHHRCINPRGHPQQRVGRGLLNRTEGCELPAPRSLPDRLPIDAPSKSQNPPAQSNHSRCRRHHYRASARWSPMYFATP